MSGTSRGVEFSFVQTSISLIVIEYCAFDDPEIATCLYSILCHVPKLNAPCPPGQIDKSVGLKSWQ